MTASFRHHCQENCKIGIIINNAYNKNIDKHTAHALLGYLCHLFITLPSQRNLNFII